jgi:hypothetical protein
VLRTLGFLQIAETDTPTEDLILNIDTESRLPSLCCESTVPLMI